MARNETKFMESAIALLEELNFTRAAEDPCQSAHHHKKHYGTGEETWLSTFRTRV
jgi:hypothetical protein